MFSRSRSGVQLSFLEKKTEKERKNWSQSLLWRWNTPLGSQVHSVFFPHWMHKYNKALRSGLGCGGALWRNEGDWRCMCPGIGTGRDPSPPNYPHSRRPCGTFSLNIYMRLFPQPWAQCAHNPLHVTSSCAWYQWAIFAPWHHLEEQTWWKIEAYLTIIMIGKPAEQPQSSSQKFNKRSREHW